MIYQRLEKDKCKKKTIILHFITESDSTDTSGYTLDMKFKTTVNLFIMGGDRHLNSDQGSG